MCGRDVKLLPKALNDDLSAVDYFILCELADYCTHSSYWTNKTVGHLCAKSKSRSHLGVSEFEWGVKVKHLIQKGYIEKFAWQYSVKSCYMSKSNFVLDPVVLVNNPSLTAMEFVVLCYTNKLCPIEDIRSWLCTAVIKSDLEKVLETTITDEHLSNIIGSIELKTSRTYKVMDKKAYQECRSSIQACKSNSYGIEFNDYVFKSNPGADALITSHALTMEECIVLHYTNKLSEIEKCTLYYRLGHLREELEVIGLHIDNDEDIRCIISSIEEKTDKVSTYADKKLVSETKEATERFNILARLELSRTRREIDRTLMGYKSFELNSHNHITNNYFITTNYYNGEKSN